MCEVPNSMNRVEDPGDYEDHFDKNTILLKRILPEMEARVEGLRMTWPAPEVVLHLHRNEAIVREIKLAIKTPLDNEG